MAHRLKKVAGRFDVKVVFSAPNKLSCLCGAIARKVNQTKETRADRCGVRYEKQFVKCAKGVGYRIPFDCGGSYVVQTGRCLNIRLREHSSSLKRTPCSHLSDHCRKHVCVPLLEKTEVLFGHPQQRTPEVAVAYFIYLFVL